MRLLHALPLLACAVFTSGACVGSPSSSAPAGPDAGACAPCSNDAGPSPGKGPDAGAHAPLGCPPGALLCLGFEGGPGSLELPTAPQNARIEVDRSAAFSGSSSLHVSIEEGIDEHAAGNPQAIALGSADLPAFGTSLYLRAYVFLAHPSRVFGQQGTLFMLSDAEGGIELQAGQGGVFSLDDWGDDNLGWKLQESPSVTLPAGRWTCVEWAVLRSAAGSRVGHSQVYVDGALAFDFEDTRMRPFRRVSVGYGYVHPQGQSGNEAWLDDVVLSSSRVGCAD